MHLETTLLLAAAFECSFPCASARGVSSCGSFITSSRPALRVLVLVRVAVSAAVSAPTDSEESALPVAPPIAVTTAHSGARRRLSAIGRPVLSSLEAVLSSVKAERRAPFFWQYTQILYSMTVPSESVAVALVATVSPAYLDLVVMTLFFPEMGTSEQFFSGKASSFIDVPTETATKMIVEVKMEGSGQATNYTVAVIRSTITAFYEFVYPDPAGSAPATSTLTGLSIHGTSGVPARMEPFYFRPQRSQYLASMDYDVEWCWVVASKNDPDAVLQLRVDGQEWLPLESGVGSPMHTVPDQGWLLLEIKVESPHNAALGFSPLVYQAVVARHVVCHERCRSCFGPTKRQCLRCRAPLVLFEGRCELTECPPNAYYEWQSYQCRRCDEKCAQCRGPGAERCSLCTALSFLAPRNWTDLEGPCVLHCPYGQFAHPPSRRCRLPPSTSVKTFYVSFVFRESFERARKDPDLQQLIINTTAFVMSCSLSDVRPFAVAAQGTRLKLTIEVVSPFIAKADADQVAVDTWFGAFDIPLDEIFTSTWDDVHPPLPTLPEEPFLPTWVWGFFASGVITVASILPLYFFYFRRLSNVQRRYRSRVGINPMFINEVVQQAPAHMIRRFTSKESGSQMQVEALNMY